eukprot:gene30957-38257_t
MAKTLDKIGNLKQSIIAAHSNEDLIHSKLTPELLFAINKQTVAITRSEYVLHMLQLAGKLDKQSDIDPWVAKFAEFDMDRDGVLTMNDVKEFGDLERRRDEKKTFSISEETRDVFLETFKLKELDKEFGQESGADVSCDEDEHCATVHRPFHRNKSLGHVNEIMIGIGLSATSEGDDEMEGDEDVQDVEKGKVSGGEGAVFSPMNGSPNVTTFKSALRKLSMYGSDATSQSGISTNSTTSEDRLRTRTSSDIENANDTRTVSTRPLSPPKTPPVSPAATLSPKRASCLHDNAVLKAIASNRSLQHWDKVVQEQNDAERAKQQQSVRLNTPLCDSNDACSGSVVGGGGSGVEMQGMASGPQSTDRKDQH